MTGISSIAWLVMVAGWLVIRWPYRRRARKTATVADRRSVREWTALGLTILGLVALPGLWALTGWPDAADRPHHWSLIILGIVCAAAFLWLFWRSHRDLGRNWSVTLEIREGHRLVDGGVYRHVRHPMYASFFLWGTAQALLIANWIAGLAGLVAIAFLYLTRVREEEAMMRATFGTDYDAYSARTGRIVPTRKRVR